ncbi:MAG: aldo/keto reductase [Vicinamibacterales bacterium]
MKVLPATELGRTGVRLTRLGLGCAPLGGLFAPVSDEDAAATLDAAWAHGVRFLDTAPLYGHGRSELRIGHWLHARDRDELAIATKVGRVLVPSRDVSDRDSIYRETLPFRPAFDFTRSGILRSFESSLERLGVGRVDILHLHDPDDHFDVALREAVPAIMALKAQGLIRAVSAGMNQWEMLARFAQEAPFDCFLLAGRYTLLDQSAGATLLPLCHARGIRIIVGGPYNSGVLATGSRGAGHYDYAAPPPAILARTEALENLCRRHRVPLRAAALQFPLGHEAVISVVAGARHPDEVADNVRMYDFPIPTAFWQELGQSGLLLDGTPTPPGDDTRRPDVETEAP